MSYRLPVELAFAQSHQQRLAVQVAAIQRHQINTDRFLRQGVAIARTIISKVTSMTAIEAYRTDRVAKQPLALQGSQAFCLPKPFGIHKTKFVKLKPLSAVILLAQMQPLFIQLLVQQERGA